VAERRALARMVLCCALLASVTAARAGPDEGREGARGQAEQPSRPDREDAKGRERYESRAEGGNRGQHRADGRRWQDLGTEERRRLEQRKQGFRSLPDAEQQRLRAAEQRYRKMSPEQRQELRRRWEGMSESERERYRRRIEQNER